MDSQKKDLTLAVAARIRHYRQIKGLSQEAAALKANLNPAYFGQLERGVKCPTIDTLYKISLALEVSLPELLTIHPFPDRKKEVADRLNDIASHIPENKRDQTLKIFEEIVLALST